MPSNASKIVAYATHHPTFAADMQSAAKYPEGPNFITARAEMACKLARQVYGAMRRSGCVQEVYTAKDILEAAILMLGD